MKKLFTLVIASIFTLVAFSQDAATFKNSGNDALRAKNYKEAIKQYEAYFKVLEGDDDVTLYNLASCAMRAKDYEKSVVLFTKCIKNRYKESSSYFYKAKAYKMLNKNVEMATTLEEAMALSPGDSKLEQMYYAYYMTEGIELQKARKIEEAADCFEKVLVVKGKKFRTDALYSLGVLYSNKGARIMEAATPIANTDKEAYATEKSKAKEFYTKALGYLEEAAIINPEREDVKQTLEIARTFLK